MIWWLTSDVAHVVGQVLGIVGMLIFGFPFFRKIHNIGNILGLFAGFLVFVVAHWNIRTYVWIKQLWSTNLWRVMLCILIGMFFVALCNTVILSFCILVKSLKSPREEKTLVILGCRVIGDKPSRMLKERLEIATDYLTDHPDVSCIVCGARGKGEDITEAECMQAYLVEQGISEERIWLEMDSRSTYENLLFAKDILKAKGYKRECILVTNGYHQYRASLIAKQHGYVVESLSSKTPLYLLPTYIVRECLGIVKFLIFG